MHDFICLVEKFHGNSVVHILKIVVSWDFSFTAVLVSKHRRKLFKNACRIVALNRAKHLLAAKPFNTPTGDPGGGHRDYIPEVRSPWGFHDEAASSRGLDGTALHDFVRCFCFAIRGFPVWTTSFALCRV